MQKYTAHKTTQKRHTKRITKRKTKRNMRANIRQQSRRTRFMLKKQKDLPDMLARIVALRAIEAGIIHIPEGEDIEEDIFNTEINLSQALHIAEAVAENADNPEPIREQIRIQADQVQRRGRGCSYGLKLGNLLHVLLSLSLMFSIHYDPIKSPLVASPRTNLVFDKVAGYFSTAATLAELASLDSVGFYKMCGVGSKLLGTASRFAASNAGIMPMTPYEKDREVLKFAEFAGSPAPLSDYLKYQKYLGTAYLARESHRKKKPVLSKIIETFPKSVVNIQENVAKSMGIPVENITPNLISKKVLESFIPETIPELPELPEMNASTRRRVGHAGKATMGLGAAALAAAAASAAGRVEHANNNNNDNN